MTIRQNDAAEGVFSIRPAIGGPFVFNETVNTFIHILIVREGGALTDEIISYNIPGGQNDFIGGQIAEFGKQETEFTITLFVIDDNIPETNETFQFEISASDSSASDILGMPSSINITILANDDYAGRFSFDAASLNQSIGKWAWFKVWFVK